MLFPSPIPRGRKQENPGFIPVTGLSVGDEMLYYLRIRPLAFSETGTSGGKVKVSFQFITFL